MLVGSPKNTREIIYLGWTKNRRTIKKQKLIPQIYQALTWIIHILRRQVPRILRGGGYCFQKKDNKRENENGKETFGRSSLTPRSLQAELLYPE